MEIITANQAREHAKNSKRFDRQLNDIHNIILSASKKGEYVVWIYFSLHEDVRQKLSQLGYKVGKEKLDRNEYIEEISWEPINY